MEKQTEDGILGELTTFLRDDFADSWRKLPNKALFFILLASWVVLFHLAGNSTLGYVHSSSLFRWLLDAYHPAGDYASSEDVIGLIVPFIVVGIFMWKLKELVTLPLKEWWPGLVLVALALVFHLLGYMIQQPRVSVVAFLAGIYFLMGLAWGRSWLRGSLFPIFLLGFCIPIGSYGQAITTPLRHLVGMIVVAIAHLGLAPDLVREGTQLFDAQSSFRYDIAPACSGIRSLTSLLALTTVFGFVCFKSSWKRLLLVLVAFPLSVLGNVLRITFTVFVAEMFGQNAGAAVEQKAGFVTFAIAIAAILLLERWLREDNLEARPLEPKAT
jgi:exosortase